MFLEKSAINSLSVVGLFLVGMSCCMETEEERMAREERSRLRKEEKAHRRALRVKIREIVHRNVTVVLSVVLQ
jgi:hypothetical protein